MKHPLENYRRIADKSFIEGIEDKLYVNRYSELSNIGGDFEITREKDKRRLKITGLDIWGEGFTGYETLTTYFTATYRKLEEEARLEIDNFILLYMEEKKQKLFLKNIIKELQGMQNMISQFSIPHKYEECKSLLLEKISLFYSSLQNLYLKNKPTPNSNKKIRWLGTNKQLGTLFFDLWKGQKGTTKNPKGFKSIIEVDTKEQLMEFIFNNFSNKKGEPLSLASLSDQLNYAESKNVQRANDNRIELLINP